MILRAVSGSGLSPALACCQSDSAEVTAYLGNRVVLEVLSGLAWKKRRDAGEPAREPSDPLLRR